MRDLLKALLFAAIAVVLIAALPQHSMVRYGLYFPSVNSAGNDTGSLWRNQDTFFFGGLTTKTGWKMTAAATGEVLKWNGTVYAPGSVNAASIDSSQISTVYNTLHIADSVVTARPPARITAFAVYNYASQDSLWYFDSPQGTFTIDSIKCFRKGGTSASINVTRLRSAATVDLLSENYATTTTMTKITTLQNTGMQSNDEYTFTVRAISGTATAINIQVFYH